MTYSDIDYVKLKLSYTKSGNDAYITKLIEKAYSYINMRLRKYITVPLAGHDDQDTIIEIEAKLAAGWFRMEKLEEEEDENKWGQRQVKEARAMLGEFIDTHFTGQEAEFDDLTGHQYSDSSWEQDVYTNPEDQ